MSELFRFPNPVNEVSARLVAGGVLLMGLACLAFRQPWLMPVMAVGFLLRVAAGPRFDPLGLLVTRVITPRLPIAERLTPGPPKRFAQSIGAVFTVSAHGAVLRVRPDRRRLRADRRAGRVRHPRVGAAASAWAARCSPLLMRVGVIPESVCEECNDLSLRWARLGASAD